MCVVLNTVNPVKLINLNPERENMERKRRRERDRKGMESEKDMDREKVKDKDRERGKDMKTGENRVWEKEKEGCF